MPRTADGGRSVCGSADPALLHGVPMSTPFTGAAQEARLLSAGLRVCHVERLRDVDTAEDAEQRRRVWRRVAVSPAPFTGFDSPPAVARDRSADRRAAPAALAPRLSLWLALAGLVAIVAVQWHVERLGGVGPGRYRLLTLILVWQALAMVVATLLRWIRPRRLAAGLIIASLIALPAASLTRGSQISDDLYRYAWDGRLQAAGVDPYRYAAGCACSWRSFRDDWLWPDTATCARSAQDRDHERPTARVHAHQPAGGAHHLSAGGGRLFPARPLASRPVA